MKEAAATGGLARGGKNRNYCMCFLSKRNETNPMANPRWLLHRTNSVSGAR